MFDSDEIIPKYRTEVQVELDDGTPLLGSLFVKQMQRVSDLLNDPREFLPFLKSDGLMIYLRKAIITSVVEVRLSTWSSSAPLALRSSVVSR